MNYSPFVCMVFLSLFILTTDGESTPKISQDDVPAGCHKGTLEELNQDQNQFNTQIQAIQRLLALWLKNFKYLQNQTPSPLLDQLSLNLNAAAIQARDAKIAKDALFKKGLVCPKINSDVLVGVNNTIKYISAKMQNIGGLPNCNIKNLGSKEAIDRAREDIGSQVSKGNQDLRVPAGKYEALKQQYSADKNTSKQIAIDYATTVQRAQDDWFKRVQGLNTALDQGVICRDPQGHTPILKAYEALFAKYNLAGPQAQPLFTGPSEALRDAFVKGNQKTFAQLMLSARVTKLDLSGLGLSVIPSWFNKMPLSNIQVLDLSRNQLTDLSGLEKMSGLKTLNVANNKLTSLKGIEGLSLVSLFAQYNMLGNYTQANPNQVAGLPFLPTSVQELVLDSNGFVGNLPKLDFPNLKRLAVSQNPGLTRVCGTDQNNAQWPFIPHINIDKLMQFEIVGASNLDVGSKICLRRINDKRILDNNPIRIVMN